MSMSMSMDLGFLIRITISDRIARHAQPGMCWAVGTSRSDAVPICKLRKCKFGPNQTWMQRKLGDRQVNQCCSFTCSTAYPCKVHSYSTRHTPWGIDKCCSDLERMALIRLIGYYKNVCIDMMKPTQPNSQKCSLVLNHAAIVSQEGNR